MNAKDKQSYYLDQASSLLDSVKGKSLDLEDRYQKSLYLAELLISHTFEHQPREEKKALDFSKIMLNSVKKTSLLSNFLDQSFRSKSTTRIADQISFLLQMHKIPKDYPLKIRAIFYFLKHFSSTFPNIIIPFFQKNLRKYSLRNIIFADNVYLHKYLNTNKSKTIISLLSNPSFGKEAVKKHLREYIRFLTKPDLKFVSVKISHLSFNLYHKNWFLAFLELEENLTRLFTAAINNHYLDDDKKKKEKLIFLNIETHQNLEIVVDVFEKLLMESKFINLKVGITLPSYFPEIFEIQKRLTNFAKKRCELNGSPIVLCIIKSLNTNLEHINAAKNNYPSPTYMSKIETDANFKKMITCACKKENATVANLNINTSNAFDIAYCLLLIKENQIEKYVHFEMRKEKSLEFINTIQSISNHNTYLNVESVYKKDFNFTIPHLLKNIDERSNIENFSTHINNIIPGSKLWNTQADIFKASLDEITKVSSIAKINQKSKNSPYFFEFENEPSTDFSIKKTREWAKKVISKAKSIKLHTMPCVINGKELYKNNEGKHLTLFNSRKSSYPFMLANDLQIDETVTTAKKAESKIKKIPLEEKCIILNKIAQNIKEKKDELIEALIIDIDKSIKEADNEVLDIIDIANYFINQIKTLFSSKDISFEPKGTILSLPSSLYPLVFTAEQAIGAFITSNSVIIKPPKEAIYSIYCLLKIFYDSGIPKDFLQFLNCDDLLLENYLLKDKRINSVIMSSSANKAKKYIKLREGLELFADAGGTNNIIVTKMADKESSIKSIITSAFEFAGQKVSSASILILEDEVYEDKNFINNLKDAASSLITDSAFNPNAHVTSLINGLDKDVKKALTHLEKNEYWLLEPKIDPNNPSLVTPGIKMNVQEDFLVKAQEILCPLLSVIKAKDLTHAIKIANSSRFGLAAGLFSLDIREQNIWLKKIHAGNCYINVKITDPKTRQQPLGGFKESSFGLEYKSGGPNYLLYFFKLTQKGLPKEKHPVNDWVNSLTFFLENLDLSLEQLGLWYASVSNYAHWWRKMEAGHDYSKILGQDNILKYVPRKFITLRLEDHSFALDALRVCAAALSCNMPLEISWSGNRENEALNWIDLLPMLSIVEETKQDFLKRIRSKKIKRVRLISPACNETKKTASEAACCIIDEPVLANGRFELLHYTREVSITQNYHRYGHLGIRKEELRKPVL